ncbi:MAG: sugar ABC transporter ATP-binding protein, partial [Acidobacteria bacterium]|nr:sugar ABC transporter ATP-binding protein [Acidobacteriota bacterium]
MSILEMTGISKRFPGVTALDDVCFDIAQGEVAGLIGENGAGKSTLMKILAGILQPDGGRICIDGNVVQIRSVRDAEGYGIGIIHQELNVLDNLDVAGNVFLGREPTWGGPVKFINRKKMESDASRHLSRLGVEISPRTPLAKLSLAQRQLVEIAKALSLNARVLIMDEPTSSLTVAESERLFEIVKELRAHGVSVIYVSHRLSEMERLADRVVVLRDGKNSGALSRSEIAHDRMVQLMVGGKMSFPHPAAFSFVALRAPDGGPR